MQFDSNDANEILQRIPGLANDVRGGKIGAQVLIAGAVGGLAALWLIPKILRFAFKIASTVTLVTAVAGAVMYFTHEGDSES